MKKDWSRCANCAHKDTKSNVNWLVCNAKPTVDVIMNGSKNCKKFEEKKP